MQIHDLVQGSPEWHQFRQEHFGASEAAAMLGISTRVKRTELLHMKHTGTAKEFSDWVQANILDYGHEVEALARPIVESIIGSDLYPVTCSLGLYSASCDGLTMSEDIAFEHKQWNAQLAESVAAGVLPDEYMPQCQQIMMVTGASKVMFVVSDGTPERMVHMDVLPDQAWFDRLVAGWAQFEKDMAEYQPKDLPEKPQADAIMHLPALAVQIRGEVTLSNLPQFKEAAERFIAKINTELKTDEDFANAEATVKFCEKTEKDLELAKDAAIAQTASIDELMRTIDFIKNQLRGKRLSLEKLVKDKKEWIKAQILQKAKEAFADHVASLEAEIRPIRLVFTQPDFVGAMKNKRTLASLHDAVDTTLANAKICVDATAKEIRSKLTWYRSTAADYTFLFNDLQQTIQKPQDDFQMLVDTRIADHKQKEEQRLQAERDRIAEEERVKAEARVKAQQQATQAQRIEAPAEQPAPSVGTGVHTYALRDVAPASALRAPSLRLGQIGERLGFAVTADFLASLGFPPAATDKSAKLYHDTDFTKICGAIAQHAMSVGRQFPAQLAA
jgi:predicted phage-related endonuclease